MKEERNYIQDIAEIRSMMERSSKFLSLSGWSGIMAGLYALVGACIAYFALEFNPSTIFYTSPSLPQVILLACVILILALITAIYFSQKKAAHKGEKIWNATSRRLLINLAVPLLTGGILILLFVLKGLIGLIAPLMLVFYGLALYNAGHYTINEVKFMGIVQIILGLLSSYFIEYGIFFWAAGFGAVHIFYGIYIHLKYDG